MESQIVSPPFLKEITIKAAAEKKTEATMPREIYFRIQEGN